MSVITSGQLQLFKEKLIPLAEEYGHELTEQEIEERIENVGAELSDDELGKVAGGTTRACLWTCLITIIAVPTIVMSVKETMKD